MHLLDQFRCLGQNKETMHMNGGGDPNKGLRRANEHKTFTIKRSVVEHCNLLKEDCTVLF